METEEKSEKRYKLTLTGDGIKIDKEIPEFLASRIVNFVMGGYPTETSFTATRKSPIFDGRLSLREFMDETGARRNPEKIVAIGAYLMQKLDQESFTQKEVKLQFKNAAEPIPGNYTRDFDWAVSNAWLAPMVGSHRDYYVTKKGQEAIANKFSADIRRNTKLKPPRRAKKKQKEVRKM